MNVWLVRPKPNNVNRITEFRKGEFVGIGWPEIGDLKEKTREELKQILSGKPYYLSGLELGNAYATVDIFVNKISSGDLILVPDGEDIFFAKVCGGYYFDKDCASDGYPHQRKVEWLRSVSRKELSMPLRTSLRVQRTVADLNRHRSEIEALAYGAEYVSEASEVPAVTVSYPLRSDYTITFDIPSDITKTEAGRLARYFETLYFSE